MKRIFILLFSLIVILFLLSKPSYAVVFFEDNFDDGISDGWTALNGQHYWEFYEGMFGARIFSQSTIADIVADYTDLSDYIYEVDMIAYSGTDKNLLFRVIDSNNRYGFHIAYGGLALEKVTNGWARDVVSYQITFENGKKYHMKIILSGNKIDIYQEGVLILSYIDNAPDQISHGKIGLRVGTGADSPSEVFFDNVLVTSLDHLPTPTSLPVPYLSQKNPLWAGEIYNQAENWSSNPFISRWGCALTSAAMTLLYHGISKIPGGIDLDPATLNNWLKNQIDGYLREGHLNWFALTRLARIVHGETSSTLLKFQRNEKDLSLLETDLEQNQPPILEVPGHFIVATGKSDDSYFINDPFWEERTTLASYNNDFLSLRRLIPTSTNLSAFLLVSNPNVNVIVKNEGDEIVGSSYFQEPLLDSFGGGEKSGQGINIFNYHEPPEGVYSVTAFSPNITSFVLDIFAYDQEAEITKTSFFGLTGPENPPSFKINFSPTTGITFNREVSFSQLRKDLNRAFSLGLIKKKAVFTTLKLQLETAEKARNKGNLAFSRKFLRGFLLELKWAKGKNFVEAKVYQLLEESTKLLLSQF